MDLRPGPGRPRAFDPSTALAAALDLFWARGFEAAGVEDLTRATGLSRSSLYATFGSKQGVLRAALAQYSDTVCARLATLAADASPRAAVRAVLQAIIDPDGDRRGCFVVNCLTELAPHDTEVAALGRAHQTRLEQILADRLGGDVERARALLGLAFGLILLRMAGLAPGQLTAALAQIDPLLPPD